MSTQGASSSAAKKPESMNLTMCMAEREPPLSAVVQPCHPPSIFFSVHFLLGYMLFISAKIMSQKADNALTCRHGKRNACVDIFEGTCPTRRVENERKNGPQCQCSSGCRCCRSAAPGQWRHSSRLPLRLDHQLLEDVVVLCRLQSVAGAVVIGADLCLFHAGLHFAVAISLRVDAGLHRVGLLITLRDSSMVSTRYSAYIKKKRKRVADISICNPLFFDDPIVSRTLHQRMMKQRVTVSEEITKRENWEN